MYLWFNYKEWYGFDVFCKRLKQVIWKWLMALQICKTFRENRCLISYMIQIILQYRTKGHGTKCLHRNYSSTVVCTNVSVPSLYLSVIVLTDVLRENRSVICCTKTRGLTILAQSISTKYTKNPYTFRFLIRCHFWIESEGRMLICYTIIAVLCTLIYDIICNMTNSVIISITC